MQWPSCCLAWRTSSGSPRHKIGVSPDRSAASALAFDHVVGLAVVLPPLECPASTYWQAQLGQHGPGHVAGVGARVELGDVPARRR